MTLIFEFIGALVWANLLEYIIHRWLLHKKGHSPDHMHHHDFPEVPGTFVKWQLWVIFAIHAALFMHRPVMVITWFLYLIVLEGVHRLMHRWHWGYHMLHHGFDDRRFNVWLPIWDFIMGTL